MKLSNLEVDQIYQYPIYKIYIYLEKLLELKGFLKYLI